MDAFRELITHIGNTLGFVRMVRSGAIESSSYAANFLPNVNKEQLSANALLGKLASVETAEAARILDSTCANIHDTFNNTNDYIEVRIGDGGI